MVKNIIKRIIVGVGIALAIGFIKGNLITSVQAKEITSFTWGYQAQQIGPGASSVGFGISGSPWANWGPGYLRFTVGINKIAGASTDMVVVPRSFLAKSGNINYICEFGSVSINNSTYQGAGYSVVCPMTMGSDGLTYIDVGFLPIGPGSSTYQVQFTGSGTFESSDGQQVNIDISSINSNIQSQTANDNRNTQQIIDSQNQTTQAIEDTNDTLKDDSVDNSKAENDINDMQSKIASNNSISQLLTLPIQLYQNILNSLNGSCSSFSLGTLFNHSITLPCINLQNLLGSTLYNIIDVLISGLFILSFRKKMVDIFNHMTSLNDRGNELE